MARIGYVSRGTTGHDALWLSTLADAGHDVTPLSGADVGGLRAAAAQHGLDAFVAGPLTDAAAAAVDADVLPTVGISWAFDLLIDLDDPAHAATLRRTVPRLAALHVDSPSLAVCAERLGLPAHRVSVAAWGIDTEFFAPGPPSAELLTQVGGAGAKVVFSARSWEPIYDVPTVVRGFARARQHEPALRLVLGGSGSQAAQVDAAVEQAAVAPYVVRIGRVDAATIRDWLRCADVYVSAARSDGSSLSLIEALAVGVPAVVTDLETNREWISSPRLGARFAAGDAAALADAIRDQLGSSDADARVRRARAVRLGDRATNRRVFLATLDGVLGGRS